MKKITLPSVRQFPSAKCCGTKASRDFIFPDAGPDGCCGEVNLNFGTGSTEAVELNVGPLFPTNTCEATIRFRQTSSFGDLVVVNVSGGDNIIIHPSIFPGYTDVTIPVGAEIFLFVEVFGGETNVQLTAQNMTCGETTDTLIFDYQMAVPPCCALQTYPMTPPVSIPGDYYDSSLTPYIVPGTCDAVLEFSFTYDRILDDPFYGVDIYWNGNSIGMSLPSNPVTIQVSPGDELFFITIMGLTGIGPGIFTFSVVNQTCGTGPDVVFVAELGA